MTLKQVFPALDLYPTGIGEVIAVGSAAALSAEMRERNAAALQARYGFRFQLPHMLRRRSDPSASAPGVAIITDDFAPADVYDVLGRQSRRRE
jgi:hypothetical protein